MPILPLNDRQTRPLQNVVCLSMIVLAPQVTNAQFFQEIIEGLPDLGSSAAVWADFDHDGLLDIAITGIDGSNTKQAGIYKNNGDGTFSSLGVGWAPVSEASMATGDIDNNGLPDVLLSGVDASNNCITKLYANQDNGVFTEVNTGLEGTAFGAVSILDHNNDGKQDLAVMGVNNDGNRITKIYQNLGNLSFEATTINLEGLSQGSLTKLDFNNDGYIDLFMNGIDNANQKRSILYVNDQKGGFQAKDTSIPGLGSGKAASADFNSDGYPDLFVSGNRNSGAFSGLYQNNEGESFTPVASLLPITESLAAWCDYDSDGDADLFFSGLEGSTFKACLYENKAGTLTDSGEAFPGITTGTAAFADYENNGKPGLLLTGFTTTAPNSILYQNLFATANTTPTMPIGLTAMVKGDSAILSWHPGTDSETTIKGFSYHIYLGSQPDTFDIVSPLTNLTTGDRKSTGFGAVSDTFAIVKNLPENRYFWSVQTIDQGYQGSAFATEQSFFVCNAIVIHAKRQGCGNEVALSYDETRATDKVSWFSETNPATPFATTAATNKTITTEEKIWVTVTRNIGCTVADTLILTPNPKTTVETGGDKAICFGDSIALGGQPTASGSFLAYTFEWSPAETLDDATAANPWAKPTATTNYRLMTKTGGCTADTSFVTVTVNPLPAIDAGEDIAIGFKEAITLNATGGVSYQWLPTEGLDDPNAQSPEASPTGTIEYKVTGTDANGCKNTDSLEIKVRTEIFVPTLFTPNNDGKNDEFFVYGIGVRELSLKVYDRWGRLVFESEGIDQGWNGKANGKDAENGKYIWSIEGTFFNGEQVAFEGKTKGTVQLMR